MNSVFEIELPAVIAYRHSPRVAEVLKRELEKIQGDRLPLQQGLARSSVAQTDDFGVTVLSISPEPDGLQAKVGIMYRGLIAGCSCADDPGPDASVDEYCELELMIRENGDTSISLASPGT